MKFILMCSRVPLKSGKFDKFSIIFGYVAFWKTPPSQPFVTFWLTPSLPLTGYVVSGCPFSQFASIHYEFFFSIYPFINGNQTLGTFTQINIHHQFLSQIQVASSVRSLRWLLSTAFFLTASFHNSAFYQTNILHVRYKS